MAGAYRGSACRCRQHRQGRRQPVREATMGIVLAGATARGVVATATNGAACGQGGRQRRVALPPMRRRRRRSMDEGRRGELGFPIRKRTILTL
ncbi:hypothetical protein B296_00053544 [Ensete ventricosum]|uniref:Uncharacterized protein n=1 Tax=Ensete ventricosum TaxID=4639 RepID=A0A426XHH5_ENSVE|nr:hypothetical protein B296_00053544 [Ensete ventricosum]